MRYFCFDGQDYLTFDTAEEAKDAAEKALDYFRSEADSDGEWSEDVERVCWGRIIETPQMHMICTEEASSILPENIPVEYTLVELP
jgi:hypothetical protein